MIRDNFDYLATHSNPAIAAAMMNATNEEAYELLKDMGFVFSRTSQLIPVTTTEQLEQFYQIPQEDIENTGHFFFDVFARDGVRKFPGRIRVLTEAAMTAMGLEKESERRVVFYHNPRARDVFVWSPLAALRLATLSGGDTAAKVRDRLAAAKRELTQKQRSLAAVLNIREDR